MPLNQPRSQNGARSPNRFDVCLRTANVKPCIHISWVNEASKFEECQACDVHAAAKAMPRTIFRQRRPNLSQSRRVFGKRRAALGLLFLAAVLLTPPLEAQWKTHWSYEGPRGPQYWGDLDPAYAVCKTGKRQSPIDIRGPQKASLPPLQFEYKSGPLKYLINNGYTIRVNYHDAPSSGNSLIVAGKRYQLTQFHFHRPSEEQLDGKPYDMEVHFMHQASDGAVVGVTVFLKVGRANATVQTIWDHLPTTAGREEDIAGVNVDPAGLLPRNTNDYYMYSGSLTAPPCTEGVTWFVLRSPASISARQVERFAKLYPHDVRPVQPLNARVVQASH
jgi:carbonic anhydrase